MGVDCDDGGNHGAGRLGGAMSLTSLTTNDLDFPTGQRPSKAVATLTAQLALAGHTAHQLHCVDFLVCKRGCSQYAQYAQYAQDPEALQHLARKLGVSK